MACQTKTTSPETKLFHSFGLRSERYILNYRVTADRWYFVGVKPDLARLFIFWEKQGRETFELLKEVFTPWKLNTDKDRGGKWFCW